MNYEDDTTEIEIPGYKPQSANVVRVDFATTVAARPPSGRQTATAPRISWMQELSPAAPWFVRLLAALTIIALSFLIL